MAEKTTIVIDANVSGATKALNNLKGSLSGIGNVAKKISKASAVAFAGLSAGMVTAVKQFGDFEDQMRSVKTLLDEDSFSEAGFDLDQGFNRLTKDTLAIFKSMPIELDKATKGMFDLVSAGVDAGQATDTLATASKLAVAGMTDVSVAVDGMTSALNAYNLGAEEADRVAGQFFLAQKAGKTTIAELSNGFGLVGASAEAAGISFEEVLSSVSAMTKAGIKTNQAYTGLKAVIANLAKPTADAEKEAKKLGIQFDLNAVRTKGLGKFINELATNTNFTKDSVTNLFGSVEAANAIFALTGSQLGSFNNILEQVNDTTKAATTLNKAYNEQSATFNNRVKTLTNQFNGLVIEMGQRLLPLFDDLLKHTQDSIKWFDELTEAQKDMIVQAGLLTVAITGITAVIGVIAAVITPLIAGIAALGLAIGGVYIAWKNDFLNIQTLVKEFIAHVIADFVAFGSLLKKVVGGIADVISGAFKLDLAKQNKGFDDIVNAFKDAGKEASKEFYEQFLPENAKDYIYPSVGKPLELEKLGLPPMGPELPPSKQTGQDLSKQQRPTVGESLALPAMGLAPLGPEAADGEGGGLGAITGAAGKFAEIAGIVHDEITSAVTDLVSGIGKMFSMLGTAFSYAESFGASVKDFLSGKVVDKVAGAVGDFLNIPKAFLNAFKNFDEIINEFVTDFPQVMSEIFNKLPNIINRIVQKLPAVIQAVVSAIPKIVETLTKEFPKITKVIFDALPEIIDIILQQIPKILDTIPVIIQQLMDVLPDIFKSILENLPAIIEKIFEIIPKIVKSLVDTIPEMVEVFAENIEPIITALVTGLVSAQPEIMNALIDSLLLEGGLERIVGALLRSMPRIANGLVDGFTRGLDKSYDEIVAIFARAWHAVLYNENLADIFEPVWVRFAAVGDYVTERLNSVFNFFQDIVDNIPSLDDISGGSGTSVGGVSIDPRDWMSKGQTPTYMADGWRPRGFDTIPAMIDPRERILSDSDNKALVNAIQNLQGGQKVTIELKGEGMMKQIIQDILVEANAEGTGILNLNTGANA